MTKLGPYEVHPFADAFPLIEGDEFDELVADIKRQGLREPIVLNHDHTVLVDGRNRWRACEAATVDPVFETLPARYTEAMVLDLILSLNIERRHLTPGQRAMVALAYESAIGEAQKAAETARKAAAVGDANGHHGHAASTRTRADLRESQERQRRSDERAAKATGASGRGVQQAKAVQRDAPDLAEKVRKGQMALDAADRERKRRNEEMKRREPPPPDPKPTAPLRPMLTLYTHIGDSVQYKEPQSGAAFNDSKGAGVSWAGWTWNPVTGCLHGCEYCYARDIATSERYAAAYPVGFTPLFHSERLDAPANTTVPAQYRDEGHPGCHNNGCKICMYRRVFVCSMADLYGRWVPDEWIAKVHASMLATPDWEYMTLTKFPARYVGLDMPPRAWVGTSVDEQKRVRIAEDAFRQIGGVAVKWLSLEPLREPLEFTDLSMFDFVVIGAQTGTRQPSGHVPAFWPDWRWVLDITQQAREAGCRVHWKPNLYAPGMAWPDEVPNPRLDACKETTHGR